MNDIFPDRKQVIENDRKEKQLSYQDAIVNEIRDVDVNKIDFSKSDFKPRSQIIEKQRVFFWIRLYLKDENISVKPDDTISIKYIPSGEQLDTKFICYAKSGLNKDTSGEIVNYDSEDDKKVLCLMVDTDRINKDSDNIPFIRTLFKTSGFYEFQLLRRDELIFVNASNDEILEYFDVNF